MKRLLIVIVLTTLFFNPDASASTSSRQDTLRVLAIGNSFSEDSMEYLEEIARAAGRPIIIGNLVIGGCSLERHCQNSLSGEACYSYQKNVCGKRTSQSASLIAGITDERWDVITVQQASHLAGIYSSYYPFVSNLIGVVRKHTSNPKMRLALHRTWAYPPYSTHSGFANYNNDQLTMFNQVVATTRRVAQEMKIKRIIPSGTAIQNGRTSPIGEGFNRDGFHLNNLGRYVAACVWFEILFDQTCVGNRFYPSDISPDKAHIAQQAAHAAVKYPDRVTVLK